MNYSLTGLGAVAVTILNLILPAFGVEVDKEGVEGFVMSVSNVLAFIILIYGQIRRKDTTGFIFKK